MRYSAVLSCSEVQKALSARLDGEEHGLNVSDDAIDAHLATCADCQEFYNRAALLNRNLHFQEPPADSPRDFAPDLSKIIIEGVEPQWRRQAATRALGMALARVATVLLGVAWIAWAVGYLQQSLAIDASLDPAGYQLVTEAAIVRFALGFVCFFAAWQPRVVSGVVVLLSALWMFHFGFNLRNFLLGELPEPMLWQAALLGLTVVVLGATWLATNGWVVLQEALRALGFGVRVGESKWR
ncbi:zf-HC2 domain-containing protein [Corynebacterium sp. 35RC1]|nr:zf-HC2 domain-containing protein [Corynebacterium sp. 35RC1]